MHFTHGALELIDTLHAHDWKVGVVSGGFHEVVDRLAADAHLDYWIANRLEAADGRLTGHVLGDIVTKDTKLESLRAWARGWASIWRRPLRLATARTICR